MRGMGGFQSQLSREQHPQMGKAFAGMGLFLACLSVVALSLPARAFSGTEMPVANATIEPVGPAGPTPAWIAFCRALPQECATDASEPAMIVLDAESWNAIVAVNAHVNASILSVTDQDHWGVADRWDYPDDGMGDCEDIQLLKRRLLTQAGLPRRALRMTVVIDEMGAGHAVLMVRTDRGDYILDNKRNDVLPWHETGYRYVKREGAESEEWVWLGNQAAPLMTATK